MGSSAMKDNRTSKEHLVRELAEARKRIAELERYAAACREKEEELHKSEETFRLYFNAMGDVIYSLDRKYRITNISPSVERFIGYRPDEIMGKPFYDLNILAPEYMEKAYRDTKRVFGCNQVPSSIYEFIARDGKRLFADVSGAPLKINGKVIGVVSVAKDVTKRILAEKALKESEERFRRITENMSDFVSEVGTDGTFTYLSPSHRRIFGEKIDNFVGASIFEAIHPDDRDRVMASYREAVKTKTDNEEEFRYRYTDGSYRWVRTSGHPLIDEEGKYIGGVVCSRDITERKEAEDDLRRYKDHLEKLVAERTAALEGMNSILKENESKYRFLAEKMNDVIWTADLDMNITYCSPSIEKAAGFTPEEFMQVNAGRRMTPESFAIAASELAADLDRDHDKGVDPDRSNRLELEFYAKDGSIVCMESEIKAIRTPAGDIVGLHGVSRNVTDRRYAEDELKKHRDHLDDLVRERTAELTKAYERLKRENKIRKTTEDALRSRESELEREHQEVGEVNSALKVLLKQREQDKVDIQEDIISNIKISVLPLLEKLEISRLESDRKELISMAKSHLKNIAFPFIRKISSDYLGLTPSEIKVASLIREGKTTKDIAEFLNVSLNTVITHRYNIRKKTGLKNKKMNLRAYLQSLE
jgi:PAS domain S-box-containing protein